MREACKHPGEGSRFCALLGRAPGDSESAGTSSSQLGRGQNDRKAGSRRRQDLQWAESPLRHTEALGVDLGICKVSGSRSLGVQHKDGLHKNPASK